MPQKVTQIDGDGIVISSEKKEKASSDGRFSVKRIRAPLISKS